MKRSLLVFLTVSGLLIAALLLRNRVLFFHTPVYEDSDFAANTILVLEAKRFQLLVGNYSRVGFNHPGPALLYWLAAAEATLYDLAHAVPAPHNGQMIGKAVFDALLLGLTLMVLAGHWRSPGQILVAAAVVLGFYGLTGNLADHWFPRIYCPIYLAFAVSVASVAAGRIGHAWAVALTGSLLVHGHVCFVMFVLPLTLAALIAALRPYRFRPVPFLRQHAVSMTISVVIVGLFVLPIALHTILHFPGEMGRYVQYSGSRHGPRHAFVETLAFSVRCMTGGLPLWPAGLLLPGLVGANVLLLPARDEPERRRSSVSLLSVAGATALLLFLYALFGVDNLVHTYTCFFGEAVAVILLTVAGLNAATVAGRGLVGRRVVAGVALAGVAAVLLLGKLTYHYTGAAYLPALREKLRHEPLLDRAPVVVSYPPVLVYWEAATALIADQLRQGRRFCLADLDVAASYSGRLPTSGWEEAEPILRLHVDKLDFSPESIFFANRTHPDPGKRFAVCRLDGGYRLGSPVALRGPQGRALLGPGWSVLTDEETVAPRKGETASFRFVLDRSVTRPLRFTLDARGVLPAEPASICYDVVVNGVRLARWEYPCNDHFVTKHVDIPAAVAGRQTPLLIRLRPVEAAVVAPGESPAAALWAKSLCLSEATVSRSDGKSE